MIGFRGVHTQVVWAAVVVEMPARGLPHTGRHVTHCDRPQVPPGRRVSHPGHPRVGVPHHPSCWVSMVRCSVVMVVVVMMVVMMKCGLGMLRHE